MYSDELLLQWSVVELKNSKRLPMSKIKDASKNTQIRQLLILSVTCGKSTKYCQKLMGYIDLKRQKEKIEENDRNLFNGLRRKEEFKVKLSSPIGIHHRLITTVASQADELSTLNPTPDLNPKLIICLEMGNLYVQNRSSLSQYTQTNPEFSRFLSKFKIAPSFKGNLQKDIRELVSLFTDNLNRPASLLQNLNAENRFDTGCDQLASVYPTVTSPEDVSLLNSIDEVERLILQWKDLFSKVNKI